MIDVSLVELFTEYFFSTKAGILACLLKTNSTAWVSTTNYKHRSEVKASIDLIHDYTKLSLVCSWPNVRLLNSIEKAENHKRYWKELKRLRMRPLVLKMTHCVQWRIVLKGLFTLRLPIIVLEHQAAEQIVQAQMYVISGRDCSGTITESNTNFLVMWYFYLLYIPLHE